MPAPASRTRRPPPSTLSHVGLNVVDTVDHYEVMQGFAVRGAREKDVLRDPHTGDIYIAKLGRRNNDLEVMTEYAIFLVGRSLGVDVAFGRIARYKGQLRFLSRYFLNLEEREELVHGVQLFNELYDESTIAPILGDKSREQSMFSVQSVRDAFGAHYVQYGPGLEEALFGGFVSMLTHDALIGVQDRHHENWGVIVQRETGGAPPRFAPLYDSARGLFCNQLDLELKRQYHGRAGSARLDRYVARAHPLFGFKRLKVRPGWHYITHPQLVGAVFRGYPRQRDRITSVLGAYEWRTVKAILSEQLGDLCSPFRVSMILTCLRRRQHAVYRAISGPAE